MLPRSDTASSTPALRNTIVAMIALLLCIGGAAAQETTLPLEPSVSVDLTTTQRESDRAAALRRAADAAALPGAAERAAIVPEFLLIQQKALADLPVVSSHPDGAAQTWRLRSISPPTLFAERVIMRLLRAGFSTAAHCPGEEWAGTHGKSRVGVVAEQRLVAVRLAPASGGCTGNASGEH
jgi:hypothetical protein